MGIKPGLMSRREMVRRGLRGIMFLDVMGRVVLCDESYLGPSIQARR